ncbi:Trafficking protein particle complex subunit 4, variant 2 [Chamberlinius hualienensis]
MAVNGVVVSGRQLEDGRDAFEVINNEANYPISLKFGRPKLNTNEKIFLASMFHSLFAISSQLSPELKSSGIEVLEADTFKLHCFQTLTGIKFVVIADPKQGGMEIFLKRIYEIYCDYALKNPFYSLEMPIRCELFDTNLHASLEQAERLGITNV